MNKREYINRLNGFVEEQKQQSRIELEIYDNHLRPKGIITDLFGLTWHRKYFLPGEFELQCALNKNNFELLVEDNLVTRLDSIEFGIVQDIKYTFDSTLGEKIIVKGKFGSELLNWRIYDNTLNFKGTAEDAIRKMVDETLISATMEAKRVEGLELHKRNGFTERIEFQCTNKNVLDQVNKICRTTNLGIRVVPDFVRRKFLFDVYKGADLSGKIVLSDEDGNIKNSHFEEINSTMKNYVLIKGEGEGADRVAVHIDDAGLGWYRREMFVDARDLQRGDMPLQDYKNVLINRGKEKYQEHKRRRTFDATTEFNNNAVYKTDWNLGDIITVRKENWGIEIQERVTEVQEIYDNGKLDVHPTFGSPLPEIKDILKGEM